MCFISNFFRRLFGSDGSDFDDQVEKRLNEWKVEKLSSPYLFSIPEKRISEQRKIIQDRLRAEQANKYKFH